MAGKKRKDPADGVEVESRNDDDAPAKVAAPVNPCTNTRSSYLRMPDASLRGSDSYFRNLYSSEPDFRQLGKKDPDFAALLKENGQLNFSDPAAVMQLTRSLLRHDFGLKIELPPDRLCPPVPNRHNYILWLKALLDSTSYNEPGSKLCGLDIGTGASCIYPLLGTAQRPWNFIATDIDDKSLSYARQNVELNGLQDRIRVLARDPTDGLIPLDDIGIPSIDFAMVNPPFYISDEEMLSSAQKKQRPPHSACTGAPVEMVCEGGEIAFVGRMLDESLRLRERVGWYTSMFGKVTSLEALVGRLRENGIHNYAVTELVQGTKTRRWVLGWSFRPMRPSQDVARGMKAAFWKKILPPVVEADLVILSGAREVGPLIKQIREGMDALELISWSWDNETLRGVGRARENVWSRAWRRKKLFEAKQGGQTGAMSVDTAESDACSLGFAISVHVGKTETKAILRWVEGYDEQLFDSFRGFVQRMLQRPS